jgi:outer membrane receptor protein involved in Fe transport
MNNAPNWLYNAEVWYRPGFLKGLRVGLEMQHVGEYWVDPRNTAKYEGYTIFNFRAGYHLKAFEVWMNLLNVTDRYYSTITSKSAFGYSYQLAEPRNINLGVSFDFGSLSKSKQQ